MHTMQPTSTLGYTIDPYVLFGVQEQARKAIIVGEPSKEKEQNHQYSPRKQASTGSPRESSPKTTEFKKRKRGRPPLEKDSRVCTNCNTAETPEWRKGPLGPHTLCNACGLQWMKAQKRENEMKSKYEETRKKNSLLRVLNGSTNALLMVESNSRSRTASMDEDYCNTQRFSPDMDTSTLSDQSPNVSPMQQVISTPPINLDHSTLSTLKAMQTINALSQMNQLNHINTLNHLNIYANIPADNQNSPPLYQQPPQPTIINPFNTNLNSYPYNLTPEMTSPLLTPRYNQQQLFLPVYTTAPSPMAASPSTPYSPSSTPFNPFLQQQLPAKPEFSGINSAPPVTLTTQPTQSFSNFSPSLINPFLPSLVNFNNPLLQPSTNLIPNPNDEDTQSVTGGGQM